MQRCNNHPTYHDRSGQIAIEFLLLVGISIFLLILVLISISAMSERKIDEKTYYELDDFGTTLQQELLLASGMENGYIRPINIPVTVNGRNFNMTMGGAQNDTSYLIITYMTVDIYYSIPPVNGSFVKGNNIIRKINDTLYINPS